MIDAPKFIQLQEQPTAVIRIQTTMAKIREVMGPTHRELVETLKNNGITQSGPWFTRHFRRPSDEFDFEVGVPVEKAITAMGRVLPSSLPSAEIARTIYRGGYEGLAQAWGEFAAWIKAQGREQKLPFWEQYLTDSTGASDPKTVQTELSTTIA